MNIALCRHALPLIVMGAGAGGVFLTTVLIRLYGDTESFADWSYLSTYLTMFLSFGTFGADQLVIRVGQRSSDGHVTIGRRSMVYIVCGSVAFAFLFLLCVNGRVLEYRVSTWNAVVIMVAVPVVLVVYQLSRLRSESVAGQAVMNSWRILLPMPIGLSLLFEWGGSAERIVTFMLAGGAMLALIIDKSFIRTRVVNATQGEGRLALAFAVSLGSIAVLNVFDRVVLENSRDFQGMTFEDYFYFMTVVAFPFNLLSTYVGYVAATTFRRTLQSTHFISLTAKILSVTTLGALGWVGALLLVRDRVSLPSVGPMVWVLTVALIAIRVVYALLSSATGVRAKPRRILEANVISVVALVLLGAVGIVAVAKTEHLVALCLAAWAIRYIAFWVSLRGEWCHTV